MLETHFVNEFEISGLIWQLSSKNTEAVKNESQV